ncbi:hypothetical protein [Amycolatopsis sp. NPDC051102]|uniref:hypothetical protein n=1 Tax=Amycolatopsis sp. NPDC051102 TaxID=3155163 RepID=UPI003413B08B
MTTGKGPIYDPGGDWTLPGPDGVPVPGSYGGGDGGAGFAYDEETLHELVREWNDLANEFRDDRNRAQLIAQAQAPGLEYASEGNAEQIRNSGLALLATLDERERYCRGMAKKFEAALGRYATVEAAHDSEIKQTGGTL